MVVPSPAVQVSQTGLVSFLWCENGVAKVQPVTVDRTTDMPVSHQRKGLEGGETVVTRRPIAAGRRHAGGAAPAKGGSRGADMKLSEACIRRPVMTTLITASFIVFGAFAYQVCCSVSALPRVDFPTIEITATLPGASPETMAASIASPIERQLSTIAGISSMSSSSSLGTTRITIQFDLNRDIDAASLDVQTALTIAQRRLPVEMTTPPSFRKVNPSDFPILFIAVRSPTLPLSTVHEYADTVLAQSDLAIARRGAGSGLWRAEIRRAGPGRSGGRCRARAVARRHSQAVVPKVNSRCRSAR